MMQDGTVANSFIPGVEAEVSFSKGKNMRDAISIFLVAGNRLLREALGKIISKQADFKNFAPRGSERSPPAY